MLENLWFNHLRYDSPAACLLPVLCQELDSVSVDGRNFECLQGLVLSFLGSPAYSNFLSASETGQRGDLYTSSLHVNCYTHGMLNACDGILDWFFPSAVYLATAKGWYYMLRSLLNQTVPNSKSGCYEDGYALHAASRQGNVPFIELLQEHLTSDINRRGYWHHTAVQAAAFSGHTEVDELLLQAGAWVNVLGGEMGSPLQAAASQGHTGIVERLLIVGAEINARSGHFSSSLQAASAEKHTRVVQALLDHGAKVNALGIRLENRSTPCFCENHEVRCRSALHWAAHN
jgi:ankyrin repeat protein